MSATKGFWKHVENGCVYAVKSTTFGDVLGAVGPLDPADLKTLDDYEYGSKIIIWLKRAIVEHKLVRFNPV
jgi:hypothetical protein